MRWRILTRTFEPFYKPSKLVSGTSKQPGLKPGDGVHEIAERNLALGNDRIAHNASFIQSKPMTKQIREGHITERQITEGQIAERATCTHPLSPTALLP